MIANIKNLKRHQRHRRSRVKTAGTAARPRLVIFRSNRAITGALVDDTTSHTLTVASSSQLPADMAKKAKTPVDKASAVGQLLAQKAGQLKITLAVFDRSGYRYHGQVKALAEGARQAGLTF